MKFVSKKKLIQSFLTFALALNFIPQVLHAEEDILYQNSRVEIECSSKRFCLQSIIKPGKFKLLTNVIIVNKKGEILKEYNPNKIKGALKKKVISYVTRSALS